MFSCKFVSQRNNAKTSERTSQQALGQFFVSQTPINVDFWGHPFDGRGQRDLTPTNNACWVWDSGSETLPSDAATSLENSVLPEEKLSFFEEANLYPDGGEEPPGNSYLCWGHRF